MIMGIKFNIIVTSLLGIFLFCIETPVDIKKIGYLGFAGFINILRNKSCLIKDGIIIYDNITN